MVETIADAREETLTGIAMRQNKKRGAYSKPHQFYGVYEHYFQSLRDKPLVIVEVGVYEGESTRVLAEYFNNSTILAVDSEKLTDFSDISNISFHQFSQTDGEQWTRLLESEAPDGVDIIIDDASHVGFFSQITFCHLFSRLKPGGFYVVEDWGSGYYPGHVDGAPFVPTLPGSGGEELPKQIKSHDYGMVGFIKWLVDVQGSQDIIMGGAELPAFGAMPFDYFHLYHGTAIAKKASVGG